MRARFAISVTSKTETCLAGGSSYILSRAHSLQQLGCCVDGCDPQDLKLVDEKRFRQRFGRELNLSQKADFSTRPTHVYLLCGWHTCSDIPLTSVPTSARRGESDIHIQIASGFSPIAKNGRRVVFEHSTERSLIKIEDVADFEVKGGRQILVWPAAGATQKDIEIFLFGPAWAALCHQRGILPLHASAIVTGKGITAFAGHSGVGKSTTAAWLNSFGYELIADDILPVSFNRNSIPGAWPYLRRLKLHPDPIIQLAFAPAEMVSETLDKGRYFVRPKRTGDDKWRRLDRIYLLENEVTDSHAPIEQITGVDAVHALVDQTYHFNFILGNRRFGDHLAFCTRLASKILIYRVRRSQLSDAGKKLGSLICAHLEGAELRPGLIISRPAPRE